jgi:acetyltransferase
VQGITAYPSVRKIPWRMDLAIIATPAHIVPQIVEECGESNIPGIIIVSSGFGEAGPDGRALEEKILKLKEAYDFRIVGPNCLGVMRPSSNLNATFANKAAKPGRIAFISQSGALCASVLDWAAQANVGFSNFVSVGAMTDVDFADLIDYFGTDPETRSIVLFIETIKDARKFMSAARRFAGTKPIIVVKAGKCREGIRAATSHTGAVTGENDVYDAAFRRVGIVRVEEIADLFNCSAVLAMQPTPRGPQLAVITNAGGPGVMATDALISEGGVLAPLSDDLVCRLDRILPAYWSRSNPIDICEDATVERFKQVLEICFEEPHIDGFLIVYTPIGAADPTETARALLELSENTDRPILASWLGEEDVREAREILRGNGIPTCPTPEQAVSTFMYTYQYARNLELLHETPEELPTDLLADMSHLKQILRRAGEEGRKILMEPESKEFLEAYGIPTAKTHVAKTSEEAATIASEIGFPVVMKILSPQITHKTDFGGVTLNVNSESQVKECFGNLIRSVKEHGVPVEADTVTVQPMIENRGYELIIGSKRDPLFGSVIVFGAGGLGVELFNDVSVGFPPLNQTLARRMMEQTKIYGHLLEGRRGHPANVKLLEEILVRFSQMIIDFPQIEEVDVNPLLIDEKDAVALDARVIIDPDRVFTERPPYEHLVIRPYPKKYVTERTIRDGKTATLRPIRPEDEPSLIKLFRTFSDETMRFRFFQVIREISHETLARYCNIDYDREMTIIAERTENDEKKMIGMGRLVVQPDGMRGEIAVVVGDPWQNLGVGSCMFDYIIEISKDMGLETIFGEILKENHRMMHICNTRGFNIERVDDETYLATLYLRSGKSNQDSGFC